MSEDSCQRKTSTRAFGGTPVAEPKSVLFVANGTAESAAGERATRFASVTAGRTQVLFRGVRRVRSTASLVAEARAFQPDLVYCIDLAAVPIAVAVLASRTAKVVVDTGDYPSAFLTQIRESRARVLAAKAMEEVAYKMADAFVVRGPYHESEIRRHGVKRVEVIPDGVDLDLVTPSPDRGLRRRLGLADVLTVGIAGHFTWYDRLGGGLGCELVQALDRLRDLPVHAVLIGQGPGLERLQLMASKLGLGEKLHVLGPVPYDRYARYLSLIDVCLLTQTNDPSSWVRTTGKLPGYLASGRFVLASDVGTARDVLPDYMLVPYNGAWDAEYPARLADRIRLIATHPEVLDRGHELIPHAQLFAYPLVAAQAASLIANLLGDTP